MVDELMEEAGLSEEGREAFLKDRDVSMALVLKSLLATTAALMEIVVINGLITEDALMKMVGRMEEIADDMVADKVKENV